MKTVKFKDFKIIPILDSLKRVDMSDEEYFSKKYSDYVSNSRLKNIDPSRGGSPEQYKNPPHFSTQSLAIGSVVHMQTLQKDDFEFYPKMGKPSAKLGLCLDYIIKYRKEGYTIYDSIIKASCSSDYYYGRITPGIIKGIISKGLKYYLKAKDIDLSDGNIILSDSDHDVAEACINSLANNKEIMDKLHPTDIFESELPSFNEDAMFIDFCVMYKNNATILHYKMKIDNWTIDVDNKHLVLNDLKTTRDNPDYFMHPKTGHFHHFRYDCQGALYMDVLKLYCMQKYGFNSDWTTEINFLVVKNNYPYNSKCCNMKNDLYKRGKQLYEELLKRVAYYEMFGYDELVEFV